MKKRRSEKKRPHYIFSRRNIFMWLFLVLKYLFSRESILHAQGSHIITGYPGSGKTLLVNTIINSVDKSKYFFLSNIGEFDGVKHFNIEDVFSDTTQVASWPLVDEYGRRLYGVIFDEINLQFNKRLNRKSDYNDLFIGLIEFLVSHRHQGVPRVYFIGQKLELQDTQLQSLFKYQHDIIKKKVWPKYWFYYENGYISMLPRKLVIMNRLKSEETQDEFIDYTKMRVKIKRENLETYNTKALAMQYLTLDKLKVED